MGITLQGAAVVTIPPSQLSAVAVSQSDAMAKDYHYPAGMLQLAALMISVDKEVATFTC